MDVVKSGFGIVELNSKHVSKRLEEFLSTNPTCGKPTHRVKVSITEYIEYPNNCYDGVAQEFVFKPTKVKLGEFK